MVVWWEGEVKDVCWEDILDTHTYAHVHTHTHTVRQQCLSRDGCLCQSTKTTTLLLTAQGCVCAEREREKWHQRQVCVWRVCAPVLLSSGKFMMQVLPSCGQAVQEDKPDKVSEVHVNVCTQSPTSTFYFKVIDKVLRSIIRIVCTGGRYRGFLPAETQVFWGQRRKGEVKTAQCPVIGHQILVGVAC